MRLLGNKNAVARARNIVVRYSFSIESQKWCTVVYEVQNICFRILLPLSRPLWLICQGSEFGVSDLPNQESGCWCHCMHRL